MTIPDTAPITYEVQRARSALADVAERGVTLLTRERHMEVLLALDNLELSSRGFWPPPDASEGTRDVELALRIARDSLVSVLADLPAHDVDPVRAALAMDHVRTAIGSQA